MSEQTPEVTVVTTLPSEDTAPVEKKFFDTKKKAVVAGAAITAAAIAIFLKVKKSSNSHEEEVLWTEADVETPTSENKTTAS